MLSYKKSQHLAGRFEIYHFVYLFNRLEVMGLRLNLLSFAGVLGNGLKEEARRATIVDAGMGDSVDAECGHVRGG